MYATQSWSTPPLSYDTVPKPESLWQPYNMQQYNHKFETIDQLQHLGTFGMKPPYQFGTHEDDPLATEYIKLEPSLLTIASSAKAGQQANHVFLSERHAAVVTKTNAAITELKKTITIDSLGRTAPFPYDTMRSAPDTSFDEHGNAGRKRATSGIQRSKWLARTFERPSSTGGATTKSSTGDSETISPNMTCRIKLLDSTACIERSQESTT